MDDCGRTLIDIAITHKHLPTLKLLMNLGVFVTSEALKHLKVHSYHSLERRDIENIFLLDGFIRHDLEKLVLYAFTRLNFNINPRVRPTSPLTTTVSI